jgi:TRAP-type C4-dicarboxylate transport system permease small subunit
VTSTAAPARASGAAAMNEEKRPSVAQSALDAALKRLTAGFNGALFVIMLGMGLVLGANIVLRYVFESPIAWSNVVTRYAYIYIVLLGTAVSYIEGSHAQIDFVYESVSKRTRAFFDLFHYLAMLFMCGLLIVYGIKHVATMWPVHSPAVSFLSMGVVYLSVPLSAALMVIFLLKKILELKFR